MKIIATVIKGKCLGGYHKIGDSFEIDGDLLPGGICLGAVFAIAPIILGLKNGAEYSWEKDKSKVHIHCGDDPGIVFEIKKVE